MIKFFNSVLGIKSEPIKILSIGDSLTEAISDVAGSATSNTLFDWDGNNLIEIPEGGEMTSGRPGSPFTTMAARLKQLTNRVTHVLQNGSGGSEFAPNGDNNNWSTSGDNYDLMISSTNSYFASQNKSKVDVIRIGLGINDARGNTNLSTIESDSISLIERLNVDFPSTPIIMNQLGKGSNDINRYNAVRGYIDNLINTYDNVYAAKDLNEYDAGLFFDGLHLSQEGYDLLGIADAEIINVLI